MGENDQHDENIRRIATICAAELGRVATDAAAQVAATAVQTVRVLAETTRIDLGYIKQDLEEIKLRLDSKFVSLELFNSKVDPLQKALYWAIALVCGSVGLAVLTLVMRGSVVVK